MSASKLPAQLRAKIGKALGGAVPTELPCLIRERRVPKYFKWQPDLCFTLKQQAILIHVLAEPEDASYSPVPSYVVRAAQALKAKYPKTVVFSFARHSADLWGSRRASSVAQQCLESGIGLLFESPDGVFRVFDAGYRLRPPCSSAEETGHIPGWVLSKLEICTFSPVVSKIFDRFIKAYRTATRGRAIAYNRECEILQKFASDMSKADPRLYIDLDRLNVLKVWERSHANPRARDHFFHTFNNLFLGYIILSSARALPNFSSAVDSFIDGSNHAKAAAWEMLWFITCLFHDPGYVGERFWSTVRFSYGLMNEEPAGQDEPIPEVVIKRILNAWDTEFAESRADLTDLYAMVARKWLPPSQRDKAPDLFDVALQKAYYDGKASSHSLLSGLILIQSCRSDLTTPHKHYEKKTAVAACVISALSMMFHDQHCRNTLVVNSVQPIPFEKLPYAPVLMFVDCLQDDRRSIKLSRFNTHGVLQDITIGNNSISARVCLREVGVEGWPGRIAEYESVMAWIRHASSIDFGIDYGSSIKALNQKNSGAQKRRDTSHRFRGRKQRRR